MEALFIYIIKSGGLLLLFYCAYYFLLRKETFFNSNRWFLLAGLFTSVILPFVVYTKTVWIDPAPALGNYQIYIPQNHTEEAFTINWNVVLIAVYSIVLLVLLIKFALDFYSLNSVLKGKKIQQQADFKFIDVNENIAPFSYFDYIVYNSSLYSASELENIIEHEKVHSDQNHTIDVLVSRFFSIIFWFNPIVWLYKKAITQNLEFIADREASKKLSDKKVYQYTLLKITTHENCVAITNHFYQSLIKKRIVMLNKNQSKKRNSWKYYVVIPALAAFVILFQVEVIAKEKQKTVKVSGENKSVDVYKIKKNSTNAELKEIKEKLKSIHNVDFEVSEIKRDANNNLTSIKVDVKNGIQQAQSIQNAGKNVIQDFGVIVITDKEGKKKIGIQTFENEKTSKDSKVTISKKITTVDSDTEPDQSSNSNIIITNNPNSKTDTNVNINSFTSTKTNSDTNTSVSTVITTNNNNDVTTISTSSGTSPKIIISNSGKVEINGDKLIIIDGKTMPIGYNLEDLKPRHIKTMHVYKGADAIAKYGDKGANGVIEIETYK
nr:M56 family metallopeptidase [Flavobacterium sp. ASV13]